MDMSYEDLAQIFSNWGKPKTSPKPATSPPTAVDPQFAHSFDPALWAHLQTEREKAAVLARQYTQIAEAVYSSDDQLVIQELEKDFHSETYSPTKDSPMTAPAHRIGAIVFNFLGRRYNGFAEVQFDRPRYKLCVGSLPGHLDAERRWEPDPFISMYSWFSRGRLKYATGASEPSAVDFLESLELPEPTATITAASEVGVYWRLTSRPTNQQYAHLQNRLDHLLRFVPLENAPTHYAGYAVLPRVPYVEGNPDQVHLEPTAVVTYESLLEACDDAVERRAKATK